MGEIGKRLIFVDGEKVEIENFDVPSPGPHQALVRIHRTQVSGGSEISGLLLESKEGTSGTGSGSTFKMAKRKKGKHPSGYTAVGHVLEVGKHMKRFKPGDRVIVMANHSSHCLTGAPSDQSNTKSINIPSSQTKPVSLVSREQSNMYPIEFDITYEQATFAGPLGYVALHGVRRAKLQIGESVAIMGQGVIGQMITAYCRLSGAYPVIAVDTDDNRLSLSKTSGATHTVNPSREDPVKSIKDLTGDGAESVFFATRVPEPFTDCINSAADHGKVIIVGMSTANAEIELNGAIFRRELDVRAVFDRGDTHAQPHPYMPWVHSRNYSTVMGMIGRGDLNVDHLISHIAKPEEANKLYHQMLQGPKGWMSVLFDWDD